MTGSNAIAMLVRGELYAERNTPGIYSIQARFRGHIFHGKPVPTILRAFPKRGKFAWDPVDWHIIGRTGYVEEIVLLRYGERFMWNPRNIILSPGDTLTLSFNYDVARGESKS